MKMLGMLFLVMGVAGTAMASVVPEIDGGTATSGILLLSGVLLVTKSRWKK